MKHEAPGFTLIEVMIGLGITTLFALAIGILVSTSGSMRKHSVAVQTMEGVRSTLVECLKSTDGWLATVQANPGLSCLTPPGADCSAAANGLPITKVMAGNGVACVRTASGLELSDLSTQGIDRFGSPCNAASAECLSNIVITWRPTFDTCIAGCLNPMAQISIRFLSSNTSTVPLNASSFDTAFIRGQDMFPGEYILLTEEWPSGTGPGPCAVPGQWNQRKFGPAPVAATATGNVQDPNGNLVGAVAADGSFTLRGGTYLCSISAPAAQVGRHQIRLFNLSTGQPIPSMYGTTQYSQPGAGAQTNSEARGLFTLTGDSSLAIQHFCEEPTGVLGAPMSAPGTPESYATIECKKHY